MAKLPSAFIVRSPRGRETVVLGLQRFCLEQQLSWPAMYAVAKGKKSHHQGWECRRAGQTRDAWLSQLKSPPKRPAMRCGGKKRCSNCKTLKAVTEFHKDSTTVHGLSAYCKQCSRQRKQASYRRRRPEVLLKAAVYRKRNRKQLRERNREAYRKNPAKYMEVYNARRRARKAGNGPVETIRREEIWRRDKGRCYLCGRRVALKRMHLEHKHPISRGGTHTRQNVAVSCAPCNLRKRDKTPEEFFA